MKMLLFFFIYIYSWVNVAPLQIVDCNIQMHVMRIENTSDLTIYYPQYSTIDLACGKMPDKNNESILFCCGASFTGELLKEFKHSNIAGNHVSGGVLYKGFKCRPNTGGFVYYDDQWKFSLQSYNEDLKVSAKNKGMGFAQNMIIYNGVTQPSFRKLQSRFQYRALCEYKGKLCIIDSKRVVSYADFISFLEKLGVTHALYLDMGRGWNHSWYRKNDGDVIEIHPKTHNFATNWIIFKK